MPDLVLNPVTQLVTVDDASPTISVLWDRAVQLAVIKTSPGPTIASRAYGILHTAMYDAWAAYDVAAVPSLEALASLQRPTVEITEANKTVAMSFAAYRVLSELFPGQTEIFDLLMADIGLDPTDRSTDTTTPAGLGNVVAETLMADRRIDGANQLGGYADTSGYTPINSAAQRLDITQWTPERVPIDAPNDESATRIQSYLTPHWGSVVTFAIKNPNGVLPPAPQPFFTPAFASSVFNLDSGTITLPDGSTVAISPALIGSVINPGFVQQAAEVVEFSRNLTDEQKLIAEFWEDAGGTSFPPGTWMTFGEFVSARDNHSLDQDAVLFFALGNAVFDAGVATWNAKFVYNYARPVRVIRDLGRLGLLGSPGTDALTNESGFVIEAWGGPGLGQQTILAENFLTYQTPGGDASPPFAEYTSGHSAFSAAGATILERFTRAEVFDASVTFAPGESRFEPLETPQSELTLSWATFREAADEAGFSRLYGGIHFKEGDLNGRALGSSVGDIVWKQVQFLANGGSLAPAAFISLEKVSAAAATIAGISLDFIPIEINGLELIDLYDELYYLANNPDVAAAVATGVFETGYSHFLAAGLAEGRNPSRLYSETGYLAANLDVAEAVINGIYSSGLEHFLLVGHLENRAPEGGFNPGDYLINNPDVAQAIAQGLFKSGFEHLIEFGLHEGRSSQVLLYDEAFYLQQNPDVAAAVEAKQFATGFDHFLLHGSRERRDPSAFFSESLYLKANGDVAIAVDNGDFPSGLAHYLATGAVEGRPVA